MANITEALPYTPAPLLISSSLLTSEQLVAQFEGFRSSLRYVSTAPELVFGRLVTNLNVSFNAALEIERQQHAGDLKISQSLNDKFQEELVQLKRTNQDLAQTLRACTCSHTSIPDPLIGRNPTPAPTLAITMMRTRPNPRIGTFHTRDVRSWLNPPAQTSKIISFDPPYPAPPGISVGLTGLVIGPDANLRIMSYTSDINTDRFKMYIDTWEDTSLPSAACSWLEIEADDPDFQFGTYNTQVDQPWDKCQPHSTREITFQRAYDAPPVVVVWLSGFDMNRGRIKTFAEGVTATGFTINIATSGDSVLYSAVLSWVAYTAGIPGVCSGRFSTLDSRPSPFPQNENSGYVRFGEKTFSATPRTMLVVNSVDTDHTQGGLNFIVEASSISAEGMKWHLNDWGGPGIYSAGASYIAIAKEGDLSSTASGAFY